MADIAFKEMERCWMLSSHSRIVQDHRLAIDKSPDHERGFSSVFLLRLAGTGKDTAPATGLAKEDVVGKVRNDISIENLID